MDLKDAFGMMVVLFLVGYGGGKLFVWIDAKCRSFMQWFKSRGKSTVVENATAGDVSSEDEQIVVVPSAGTND